MTTTIPVVTDYLNYRQYLNDYYSAKKRDNNSYSYRVFINRGQLGSPSHLKMVIDGERNLTTKTIPKYLQALGLLNKSDCRYFELLVLYNQELDPEQRISYFNDLMALKRKKGLSTLQKHQFDLLSRWYYVAIYVLIDLPAFRADTDWISEKLKKRISPLQVREVLDSLETLKLIVPDKEKGYRQAQGALSTDDEVRSLSVYRYHKEMLELALSSLNFDDPDLREFNGVTLTIRKDQLRLLKEKIRIFRREINELTSNMDAADDVYQMNIQLFPLTEVKL